MKNTKHIGAITQGNPAQAQENKQEVVLVYGLYEGLGLLAGVAGYLLGKSGSGSYHKGNGGGDNNCDFC